MGKFCPPFYGIIDIEGREVSYVKIYTSLINKAKQFQKTGEEYRMYGSANCKVRVLKRVGGIKRQSNWEIMESVYAPRVQVGDVVVVKYLETDENRAFLVLSDAGDSFKKDSISLSSPIGSAVFSKPVGKVLDVRTPNGIIKIQIQDIQKHVKI